MEKPLLISNQARIKFPVNWAWENKPIPLTSFSPKLKQQNWLTGPEKLVEGMNGEKEVRY